MTLTLMVNSSPQNYVNKKTSNKFEVTGTLRQPTSITDPVIELQIQPGISPGGYNYAYIDEFQRYYYVTDWITNSNNLWECHMHVDVLSSFWNRGLRQSPCVALRSTNKKQYDLPDAQMLFTADTLYSCFEFPKRPFSSTPERPYVMVVAGAGKSS